MIPNLRSFLSCMILVLVCIQTVACKKGKDGQDQKALGTSAEPTKKMESANPPPASKTKAVAQGPMVEVEITGTLQSETKVDKLVVIVSKGVCGQNTLEPSDPYNAVVLVKQVGVYSLEVFVPQGTLAYFCGLGLDSKNNLIAIASYAKNPVEMKGEGEVMIDDVKLVLKRVPKPFVLPASVQAQLLRIQ